LRTHVEDRLIEAVGKYFDVERPVDASVTFSKDRHEFVSDLSVHLPTGLSAQSKSRSSDIYACFEGSVERMDKQLRRYKRRLKDHHRSREIPIEAIGAPSYILAGGQGDEEAEPDSLQPVIIAEMETPVRNLSVGEAVMQMELVGAPLLVFRNEKHGGVNVVYTREDGNIGWIDPRNSQ
jgi:ribosomal subunit interface protein